MSTPAVIIVGGGAAGFFAAVTCAEANPAARVTLLEKGPRFLSKVRISGGGRCNVTHACFEPRTFATRYPRGQQPLIGPFQRFQAADTVEWFQARGVPLKTEDDGRMFPITDSSQTIIDCLQGAAQQAGVTLRTNCSVDAIQREPGGTFTLRVSGAAIKTPETLACDRLLLATGGCRTPALALLATQLGHSIAAPVPSLFTFHVENSWLPGLAGISVPDAEVSIGAAKLRERGPVLVTHWGLSGPAILRLSAWGARSLHAMDYRFPIQVNWLPEQSADGLMAALQARRSTEGARHVVNSAWPPLPGRLWEQLVLSAGIGRDTRWAALTRSAQQALALQLRQCPFEVTGKSLNKDEFVTCGGVKLAEVNMKTMESRLCPGLFFAGEVLDIDGLTGGFNFQAAWTTGWLAGHALAAESTMTRGR
jgi:predicted Rossmann fold flavoprotein